MRRNSKTVASAALSTAGDTGGFGIGIVWH
jgi:hypothetical protein